MLTVARQDIDEREILRYLGYNGQTIEHSLRSLLEESIGTCLAQLQPRFLVRQYPIETDTASRSILVKNTTVVLQGQSIWDHLAGAEQVALFAATLGAKIETSLRMIQHTDKTKMLLMDAAANECIEKLCDKIEKQIIAEAAVSGHYTNDRFSPGYGDLPLSTQAVLLAALDSTKTLGLTCTPDYLMIPRKSVTAIVGLFAQQQDSKTELACAHCSLAEHCQRRKRGIYCGTSR